MSAFTTVTTKADWIQNLDKINEIVLSYSERRQAIGDSAVAARVAGDDAHAQSFWRGIQNWLEAECVHFVNDAVAIAGESAVTMFTLATWRTAAGINASGFRRATVWEPDADAPDWTVDPEYAYGKIAVGDIYGPWILDDLQKGLAALKWTNAHLAASAANTDSNSHVFAGSGGNDCATDRGLCEDNYDAGWGSTWGYAYYICIRWASSYYAIPPDAAFSGFSVERAKSAPKVTIPVISDVTCDWQLYVLPSKATKYDNFMPPVTFVDLDAGGWVENELDLWDSGSGVSSSGIVADELSGTTTFPMDLTTAVNCPLGGDIFEGMQVTMVDWILKWNFSYQ